MDPSTLPGPPSGAPSVDDEARPPEPTAEATVGPAVATEEAGVPTAAAAGPAGRRTPWLALAVVALLAGTLLFGSGFALGHLAGSTPGKGGGVHVAPREGVARWAASLVAIDARPIAAPCSRRSAT